MEISKISEVTLATAHCRGSDGKQRREDRQRGRLIQQRGSDASPQGHMSNVPVSAHGTAYT